jgi:hypothetical protein
LSLQETTEITFEDLEALRNAVKSLEHPGFAGRLTNIAGKPVELIGYALPSFASKAIASATSKGLEAALKVALRTLSPSIWSHSQLLHRALATASGAAGGTFGLAALPVELPVSTVIMLRSIADIARTEGEDLSNPETALACVEVFALEAGPDRRTRPKAAILPSGAYSPRLSRKLRGSWQSAASSRKARRSY